LWRTGFFLSFAEEQDYIKKEVVQKGNAKGGLDYLRITNIRGMKSDVKLGNDIWENYIDLSQNHL
jgi:hypothetical protein